MNYDSSNYTYVNRWLAKIKNALPKYDTLGIRGENAFKEMTKAAMK